MSKLKPMPPRPRPGDDTSGPFIIFIAVVILMIVGGIIWGLT